MNCKFIEGFFSLKVLQKVVNKQSKAKDMVSKRVHCHDRTHPLHLKKRKWWPPKCLGFTCGIVSLFTHYCTKKDFLFCQVIMWDNFIRRVPPSATALGEGPLVGATRPILWPPILHKTLIISCWRETCFVSFCLWQWISLLGSEESQIHMQNYEVSLPLFVWGVVE
jgi:hypothetical protein